MQPYGKEVAEKIIKCRDDDFTFKDGGVFPKDDRPSSDTEFDACTWRPACELSGQAGQKLREKPALPIPFNENELAAFFLHGWGWYVRDSFGSWDDGPDESAFEKIDHLERGEVKDAVTGAFHAYRAAECAIGKFDNTLACMAQELDDAFWNANVSLRTAECREALRIAYKKADEAESAWRKKMVNQLLKVEQVPLVPTITTATVQPITTPEPVIGTVEPAIDGSIKIKTGDRGWVLKKAALIAKHASKWDTIRGDFHSASENGLSKSAKAPGHGEWYETDALNWARQRGKLNEQPVQVGHASATPWAGLTHRCQG